MVGGTSAAFIGKKIVKKKKGPVRRQDLHAAQPYPDKKPRRLGMMLL